MTTKKKPEPKLDEIVKPDLKIKVKKLYFDCYIRKYTLVHLEIDDRDAYSDTKEVRMPVKRALATLRKAVQAYRHSPLYKGYHTDDDLRLGTTSDNWKLPKEIVYYFADWFEFSAPLETLLVRAEEFARVRRKEIDEENLRRGQTGSSYGSYGWNASTGGYSYNYGNPNDFFSRFYAGMQANSYEDTYNDALKVLGVAKDGLTVDIVKKAYKRLALKIHPDVGGDAAKFRELNDAYNLLLKRLQQSA